MASPSATLTECVYPPRFSNRSQPLRLTSHPRKARREVGLACCARGPDVVLFIVFASKEADSLTVLYCTIRRAMVGLDRFASWRSPSSRWTLPCARHHWRGASAKLLQGGQCRLVVILQYHRRLTAAGAFDRRCLGDSCTITDVPGSARRRKTFCPRSSRPRIGCVRALGEHYFQSTWRISKERGPFGVDTSTLSPTDLPIRARAIGEEIEILPSRKSDSRSPTIL